MSQQDVANLRHFLESWDPRTDLEAWKRGEPRGLSLFDPEMTYEDTILPDHVGETYRGYDGLARATERWLEPSTASSPIWNGSSAPGIASSPSTACASRRSTPG